MKTGKIGLVVVVLCGVFFGTAGFAQVQFPTIARRYSAWMVRAMDECNPATLSVTSPGVPTGGCFQTNVVTDDVITMHFARLIVTARSRRAVVFGRGLQFGKRVRVQLTLRTTHKGLSVKHPPGTNKTVTFQDTTLLCPNPTTNPFGFTVLQNGALLGIANLQNCLGTSLSGLATGNIEITDAALINVDNGKVFARPGILR